eukprot:scaffold1312_cov393-Prasinococcus_capsulatus_cf.AAC.4
MPQLKDFSDFSHRQGEIDLVVPVVLSWAERLRELKPNKAGLVQDELALLVLAKDSAAFVHVEVGVDSVGLVGYSAPLGSKVLVLVGGRCVGGGRRRWWSRPISSSVRTRLMWRWHLAIACDEGAAAAMLASEGMEATGGEGTKGAPPQAGAGWGGCSHVYLRQERRTARPLRR